MALICACHRFGWPVARGGSRAITDALAAVVARARRHDRDRPPRCARWTSCRRPTRSCSTSRPAAVAEIAGDRLPARVAPRLPPLPARPGRLQGRPRGRGRRAVDATRPAAGPAPSTSAAPSRRSSPPSARSTAAGCRSGRSSSSASSTWPTPTRSAGDVHPVWAYAHVPSGYDGDATEAVLDQIERFAPGLRERIVAPRDALAGRARGRQRQLRRRRHHHRRQHAAGRSLVRPRLALDPYATGIPGVYICSAATPPGAGVHGMCGYNAAQAVLRDGIDSPDG